MKKLPIKDCVSCPYFANAGVVEKVMYQAYCAKASNRYLPYIKRESRSSCRYYATPTYMIPDWCPLEDY